MRALFARLKKLLERLTRALIWVVQKVLLTLLLFVIYVVGVGLTLVLAALFGRRLLRGQRKDQETFWVDAVGYEARKEDLFRQS